MQGGSTLTQQLAKNLFLDPNRTFDRKMQEAMLALYLESRYSKNQILTLYLNRVYFGAGVFGIEAAAEHFFGKHAGELTPDRSGDAGRQRQGAGALQSARRYRCLAWRARRSCCGRWRMPASSTNARALTAQATRPRIVRGSGTPGGGYFADWVVSRV